MVSVSTVAHPELAPPTDKLRRLAHDFRARLTRPKSGAGWGAGAQRDRGAALRVEVGSTTHTDRLRPYAASPARRELQTADGTTFWFDVPAAGPHNTAVIWDAGRKKLIVGVWSAAWIASEPRREPARRLRLACYRTRMPGGLTTMARALRREWHGAVSPCIYPAK
jgi:hypothetical protein